MFFVLKENRSYDQVLGDVPGGNGDAALAWFGRSVTPNEHAIAARFGLFDNAYTSGEVSAPGHMWADAAFADDYVERFWPPSYGDRREIDDLSTGSGPRIPANGFLWDAARRANVSFLDYGEQTEPDALRPGRWLPGVPSLNGRIDPLYAGWDLDYSDVNRVKEWRRDFAARVASGTVPQLEFIWLPGDHTYGSKAGKLAPASYVAINDFALGQMVDTLSHSKIWKSSAMFVIEDDAQDGPDHVSDQRTTLCSSSRHTRAAACGTSITRPSAFCARSKSCSAYSRSRPTMRWPFRCTARSERPRTCGHTSQRRRASTSRGETSRSLTGSATSARLDFSRPDATPAGVLEDILAHNHP